MHITGALFANEARIGADAHLTINGGVWDHFDVPSLPQGVTLPLALLCQRSAGDGSVTVEVDVNLPDGSSGGHISFDIDLGSFEAENMALTTSLPLELTQLGRHVFLFSVNGTHQAALPLHVRLEASA